MSDLNKMTAAELMAALKEYNDSQQPAAWKPGKKDDDRTRFLLTLPPNQFTEADRQHLTQAVQEGLQRFREGRLD